MTDETRPKLAYGEFAPIFTADLDIKDRFGFGQVGGRWVVLQFLVRLSSDIAREAHQVILDQADLFDGDHACYFGVIVDPADFAAGHLSRLPGRRYFKDFDEAITRSYGVQIPGGYLPLTVLLDPNLRVVAAEPLRRTANVLDLMRRCMAEDSARQADRIAPVLTVPRIFEPEFCKMLIDYYGQIGGKESGFMRQRDGKTVGVRDPLFKRRKDVKIIDEHLRTQAMLRIQRRLLPAIEQAYNWRGTRIERYIVACYAAEDLGFFRAHRDNTTTATAHRKFAVTLNLNSDDYEGGGLRFPEFGQRTYKPPTGGATVFACGLLHEATPVTKGVRYAFLPFLYDEESAKLREQNAGTLAEFADEAERDGESEQAALA